MPPSGVGKLVSQVDLILQVDREVMTKVRQELGLTPQDVWIRITDVCEGRKEEKALKFVRFYSCDPVFEDDEKVYHQCFTYDSLNSIQGLRLDNLGEARRCFCHLLYWRTAEDGEDRVSKIWDVFERYWRLWKDLHAPSTVNEPSVGGKRCSVTADEAPHAKKVRQEAVISELIPESCSEDELHEPESHPLDGA
jgi:hypothetical protein